ncbi:hypothetical protein HDU98_002899, partial [Podochytrium sp. JEL0797]
MHLFGVLLHLAILYSTAAAYPHPQGYPTVVPNLQQPAIQSVQNSLIVKRDQYPWDDNQTSWLTAQLRTLQLQLSTATDPGAQETLRLQIVSLEAQIEGHSGGGGSGAYPDGGNGHFDGGN